MRGGAHGAGRGRPGGAVWQRLSSRGRCRPPRLESNPASPPFPSASISQRAARKRGRKSRAPESGKARARWRWRPSPRTGSSTVSMTARRVSAGAARRGRGWHRGCGGNATGRGEARAEPPRSPSPLSAPHVAVFPVGTVGGRKGRREGEESGRGS